MKPIVFPFTQLSEVEHARIISFIDSYVLYQPLENKAYPQRDGAAVCIPVLGKEDTLCRMFDDYMKWADIHKGKKGLAVEQFTAFQDAAPLCSKNSTTRIFSDIKKKIENRSETPSESPDLMARLFLMIVQDYDENMDMIQKNFCALDKMEATLMDQLKGHPLKKDPEKTTNPSQQKDCGEIKTEERIKFWAYLMLNDPEISGVYISHSASVMQRLLDAEVGLKPLITPEHINDFTMSDDKKGSFKTLSSALCALSKGDVKGDKGYIDSLLAFLEPIPGKEDLTIFWAEGVSPLEFFDQFIPDTLLDKTELTYKNKLSNTIIMHMGQNISITGQGEMIKK